MSRRLCLRWWVICLLALGMGGGCESYPEVNRLDYLGPDSGTTDSGAADPRDPAQRQQRAADHGAGVPGRDEGIRLPGLDEADTDKDGGLRLGLKGLHGMLVEIDDLLGVDDTYRRVEHGLLGELPQDVPATDQDYLDPELVGRLNGSFHYFMGGIIAAGGVNSNYH